MSSKANYYFDLLAVGAFLPAVFITVDRSAGPKLKPLTRTIFRLALFALWCAVALVTMQRWTFSTGGPRLRTAAGVEITNGALPGVRLRAQAKAIPVQQINAMNDK